MPSVQWELTLAKTPVLISKAVYAAELHDSGSVENHNDFLSNRDHDSEQTTKQNNIIYIQRTF